MFLGRELPKIKSVMSMIGITVGAIYYVNGDVLSNATSYALCVVFIIFACLEGSIAKDTINRYKMNSWSRTFLMNLMSIPIAVFLTWFTGELSYARKFEDVKRRFFFFIYRERESLRVVFFVYKNTVRAKGNSL